MSPETTTTLRARSSLVLVLGAIALVAGFLVLPGSANAGPEYLSPRATPTTCDEAYGCETTSTQPPIAPACSVTPAQAQAGTKVTATLTNVPVGTEASLLFDGTVVATETATADGQGQAALSAPRTAGHLSVAAHAVTELGGVVITFTIPADATAGTHTLVFSGAGFSCDATNGNGFSVLAAAVVKKPGSLSKTGIEIAMYLAVALVLIVVGLQLVRSARARRRRIRRRRNTVSRQPIRR